MIINFSFFHLILSNCWKAYLLFKWKCQIAHNLLCFSLSHRENYPSSVLFPFHCFARCKRKTWLMQWNKNQKEICAYSHLPTLYRHSPILETDRTHSNVPGYWDALRAGAFMELWAYYALPKVISINTGQYSGMSRIISMGW